MNSATVFPSEVETENYLTRRTIRGASVKIKGRRPSLKSRWSSHSVRSHQSDNHNLLPMVDVKASGADDKTSSRWDHTVVDIKKEKRGHWIIDHFEKKECIRYVPDTAKPYQPCFCGRTKQQHVDAAVYQSHSARSNTSIPQPVWDPVQDVERAPTDAFGEIAFFPARSGRQKPAKYVRLTEDADPQDILKLLIHQWRLPRPKLVISVTGGAKNFKLNEQDQQTFNRGLIRASQATGAWLLTGGTNIGVTKCVGIALREGQSMKWVQRKAVNAVNCIGIAPWGYIENTDKLTGKGGQGLYPALYNVNAVIGRGSPVPLNPDHTHFILVDNGKKNKYGADLVLRPKIEKAIAAPQSELGQGIPVVLVVLEGGIDAITNTKNAICRGIPTVVCEGTGRAADIISYAHNHAIEVEGVRQLVTPASIQTLKDRLNAAYDVGYDSSKMISLLQDVNTCIHQEHLITVFEMDRGENSDLDLAILTALLKGQLASPAQQLSLALSWNRVDVAESKIFSDEIVWPDGSLDPFITSALVHNHVEFLRLFLEHGAIMKEYLTVSRLRRLYNAADADHHLRVMLSTITKNKPHLPIYLHDIGRLLHYLTGAHHEPLYQLDKRVKCIGRGSLSLMVLSTSLSGTNLVQKAQEEFVRSEGRDFTTGSKALSMIELANPGLHFEQPFKELFLWAVLMNRIEMAEFFWQRCENPISTAIAASQIMYKIGKKTHELDLKERYKSDARQFEALATNVIEECHKTDEEFAGMLIDCPLPYWQGRTTLTMAASANDQEFISHPCCQSVLQRIWLGGLQTSHWWLIIMTIFMPLLIYFLDFKALTIKNRLRRLHWFEKPFIFYKAPVTKFWMYVIHYIAFLLLYSYVLLFQFRREATILEYVLFAWIGTMVLQELTEIIPYPNSNETLYKKFKKWVRSEWNIMDFFMLTIAIIGFTLHMNENTFGWARTLYALNGCIFFVRLLRMFAVSDNLGPKLVMIKRMMKEMLIFLCVLSVFLVGYGVASQALLYPNQDFNWIAVKNIFYMPYFQVYGELFLEVIVDGQCDSEQTTPCPTKHPVALIMLAIYLLFTLYMICDSEQTTPCPTKHPVAPIMLAIYLLLGNVLLLNLLIAVFSYIFDDVQTNSLKIWKYELYSLVTEIEARPILPPPFNIIELVIMGVIWLYKTIIGWSVMESVQTSKYSESEMRQLRIFENECAANYRHKKTEQENAEVQESISRIETKLDELAKQTESTSCSHKASAEPQLQTGHSTQVSHPQSYASQQSTNPSTQWLQKNNVSPSPRRLPPIQENPLPSPSGDGQNPPWDEHDEDTDNVVLDHQAIPQDGSRERIPPDGVSVITEKRHHRSRQSKTRRSASLPENRSPKSKHRSSQHQSDRASVVTTASRESQGSKYSNDPMSDFRLKLLFDSNQQDGQSTARSKVSNKQVHSSSSSSSSSDENSKKIKDGVKRKGRKMQRAEQSEINVLHDRMNQLEQSSLETQNALQRIEQLLQLVVQSNDSNVKN
ncbi:transient receptor potential cation channel subfamily M member-like 2 [Amphiura filiformis]|uniref:transient receptor potential cation channel subfamily M member-like 2 n=1 Tax=Amphiura filiformis TaxID=82378 RepID=UPI003B2275D3